VILAVGTGGEDNAAVDPHGSRHLHRRQRSGGGWLGDEPGPSGGNLTGLYVFELSIGAKLLELLKEIAPHVARAAILFNPDAKAASWLAAAAAMAPRFAVEVIEALVRDSNEIESAMAQWGRQPNYGLIVLPDPATNAHRKLINELAARYRPPSIHALSGATRDGGLMSYGINLPDAFRQAAAYADRILKGDKPADLPVQLPTKFELAINLKTAKALGLIVPNSLMVTADEVGGGFIGLGLQDRHPLVVRELRLRLGRGFATPCGDSRSHSDKPWS
jgi:ABC-type uncharacterized transport system substrate-binding protein